MSDEELARYLRSAHSIARFVWRSVRLFDLDDLMAEANMAVVAALASYKPSRGASRQTYVHSYVRWRLWDAVRSWIGCRNPKKTPKVCQLSQALHLTQDAVAYEAVLLREREVILEQALERLSPAELLVVDLRYRQGLSFTEISGLMGYARGTAWQRCHRAVRKLRRLIKYESGP